MTDKAVRIFQGLHFFPPLEIDASAYSAEEASLHPKRIKVEQSHEFSLPLSGSLK